MQEARLSQKDRAARTTRIRKKELQLSQMDRVSAGADVRRCNDVYRLSRPLVRFLAHDRLDKRTTYVYDSTRPTSIYSRRLGNINHGPLDH